YLSDPTGQAHPIIWGQGMTLMEGPCRHDRLIVWVEHGEVGVIPDGYPTLAVTEARHTRRRLRQPFHHVLEVDPAPAGTVPHRRQPQLEGGDPAPGGHEVTLV